MKNMHVIEGGRFKSAVGLIVSGSAALAGFDSLDKVAGDYANSGRNVRGLWPQGRRGDGVAGPGENGNPRNDPGGFSAGGCQYKAAADLPGRCYRDECGKTYVNAGGAMIEIKRPDTIRARVMPATLVYDADAADQTLRVEIQPLVNYFAPQSLIVDVLSQATGGTYTPSHVLIENLKIGSKEQSVSKLGQVTGPTSSSAAFTGGIFQRDALNNLFDFDVATPQLGIIAQGTLAGLGGAPTGTVKVCLAFFGITFESLQRLRLSHGNARVSGAL